MTSTDHTDDLDGRPSLEEIEAYAAALRRSTVQALARRHRITGFTADDIAQEVVLTFLEHPVRIMATYGEPWIYARASTASRVIDLGRRDRAQRGEGARLVVTADGCRPRRLVVWFDEDDDAVVPTAATGHGDHVEDLVVDRLALDHLLGHLTDEDRRLLRCVDGLQYSVTEVAAVVGLARETVSRRLSALRRSLAEQVET